MVGFFFVSFFKGLLLEVGCESKGGSYYEVVVCLGGAVSE